MDKLICILAELEKLKYVERGTSVKNRQESTAEHSWSAMMIADILIDFTNEPLDRLKVIEYLMYHDIAEIYAGDAKFNNPQEMLAKQQRESDALEKIKNFIPNAERFQRITSEYENRKTREAEFAKAIDCLDACIRNINDDTKTANDGFTEALIRKKYTPHVSKFNITHELFESCLKKLIDAKKL